MLPEDYITEVYCLVDDMLKKSEKTLRRRGRIRNYQMRK